LVIFGILVGSTSTEDDVVQSPVLTSVLYQSLAIEAVDVMDVRIVYAKLNTNDRHGKSLRQIFSEALNWAYVGDEKVVEVTDNHRQKIGMDYVDSNIVILQILKFGEPGSDQLEFFYVYKDDLPYGYDQ
jgi:hypothetical protein